MVEIYNSGKNGPKTHVLLIGVGDYPYLKGGSKAKPQSEELKNLGQLTSPIASVRKLYERVVAYDAEGVWSKPLGSIEILVSAPAGAAPVLPGLAIENASLANIQAAYFSWKARCNEDEDNVAVFYYCGHGFQKKYHFLLADDFGKIPENPWLGGAFNFDDTRDAFYSCKAKTPVFLVDACRQVTLEMLEKDLTVAPIDIPSLLNPEESKHHLTLKATASGESAYGKIGEPTYFVQAVIGGLDGLVARQDENDDWLIETSNLGTNIHVLLDLINPEQSFRQRCQIACGLPASIIQRKEAPLAWLEVTCDPDQALPLAGLTCTEDVDQAASSHQRAPMAGNWRLSIKAAMYKLSANFQAGDGYKNSTKKTSLIPPVKKVKLECL